MQPPVRLVSVPGPLLLHAQLSLCQPAPMRDHPLGKLGADGVLSIPFNRDDAAESANGRMRPGHVVKRP